MTKPRGGVASQSSKLLPLNATIEAARAGEAAAAALAVADIHPSDLFEYLSKAVSNRASMAAPFRR